MSDRDYATISGTKLHRRDFAYAPEGSRPSEWKLPIHDAAHVRNALARFHQTDLPAAAKAEAWRKIVAAAKKFAIEVSGKMSVVRRPWSVATDNGRRTTDAVLSEVKNGLVKIAVAYTGDFERDGQKFSITAQDLKDMARNLGTREAPIDYEHQSAMGAAPPGWARAAGWIRRPAGVEGLGTWDQGLGKSRQSLAPAPQPLALWAWAELTPACLAMVKQKEYRYFSPEIHWKDHDESGEPIGTRLAAGAMTNRPFLKDLPPIEIGDEDYNGLFGIPARTDGRLAMVALSEGAESNIENRKSKIGLMDLDSVHVPAASKQVSVAYHQPGSETETRNSKIENRQSKIGNQKSKIGNGESIMAKKFSFRKLTDGPHVGKFGLYKSDALMMDDGEPMVFEEEDFPQAEAGLNGGPACEVVDGNGEDGEAVSSSGQAPLAATEARVLAEVFREGRVEPARAAALAEQGRLALGAVFRAQAAEKLVEGFIAEGKLLPKRRAAAFRLALEDEAGLRALLSDARPLVDFAARGLAGAAHLAGSAQMELDEMVRQWIAEHHTDYSAALSEVTKRNPELWQRASAEVSARAQAGTEDQE